MEIVEQLVARLRVASLAEREVVKQEMIAAIREAAGNSVRDAFDTARKGELLEIQWEIEEVLEAVAEPKAAPAPAPAPPPEPEAPPGQPKPLTSKDLTLMYDDPRGLLLHKSKVGDRWFATQVNPQTQQPQTFELHPQEVAQLKVQLAGSPYWVQGSGSIAVAPAGLKPSPLR